MLNNPPIYPPSQYSPAEPQLDIGQPQSLLPSRSYSEGDIDLLLLTALVTSMVLAIKVALSSSLILGSLSFLLYGVIAFWTCVVQQVAWESVPFLHQRSHAAKVAAVTTLLTMVLAFRVLHTQGFFTSLVFSVLCIIGVFLAFAAQEPSNAS